MRTAAPYMFWSQPAPVPVPSLNMPQPIQSPCTRVCTIDRITGLCTGCGRTLEEIARWSLMSEDERQRIMADLADRRAAVR